MGDHVRLTGLVDQFRDLEHRLVDRHVLELLVHHQPEQESQSADEQTGHQQSASADAVAADAVKEGGLVEVGELEIGFTAGVVLSGGRRERQGLLSRLGERKGGAKRQQHQESEHAGGDVAAACRVGFHFENVPPKSVCEPSKGLSGRGSTG